ncbi:MAG TPA: protein kinase [Pyrinomonadaceae bacterium]|jgi:serine/threonine protein kinase
MAEDKSAPIDKPSTRRDPYRLTGEMFGGRYRLEAFAGMGSFGAVYRATDTRVGRMVALKILKPDLGDDEATEAHELFQREAITAGRLIHPHIVALTDVGEEVGFSYLIMEWLEGCTLEDEMRARAPFSPEETLSLLAPISDALAAAHDAGVIHRDIKPSNIHLGRRDRLFVKVLDFGIAKVVTSSTAVAASRIAGTVAYMSPEQIIGSRIDRRTDIYSLGILLYQMLTGELPFKGESHGHIIQQHIAAQPPPLHESRPDLSFTLSNVIQRALSKLPEARQQSARELYSEFADALKSPVVQSAPRATPSSERKTEVLTPHLPPTVMAEQQVEPPPVARANQYHPVSGPIQVASPTPTNPQVTADTDSAGLPPRPEISSGPKPEATSYFPLIGTIAIPLLVLLAARMVIGDWYFTDNPHFGYVMLDLAVFGLLMGTAVSVLQWSRRERYFALGGAGALFLLTYLAPSLINVAWRLDETNRLRYLLLHNILIGALIGLAVCALSQTFKLSPGIKTYLICGTSGAIITMLLYYVYQLTQFSRTYSAIMIFFHDKLKAWMLSAFIGFLLSVIAYAMRASYKQSTK